MTKRILLPGLKRKYIGEVNGVNKKGQSLEAIVI